MSKKHKKQEKHDKISTAEDGASTEQPHNVRQPQRPRTDPCRGKNTRPNFTCCRSSW
jgi:hypothetical protein